ncbi:hypothetical protein Tco_1190482 [Tanacetum coccineum]
MKTQNRKKSISKKLKTNEDVEKQKEITSPSKEKTPESTPIRRTKATAARGLRLQNTPPRENPSTTPQTETTNVQNTRILSPVIQNDSTQTPAAKAVEIKEKSGKNYETTVVGGKKQAIVEKKEKEQVNKKKRDEKAKKEEEVKKKIVKIKGKKKVEDDDGDFVVEEPHDEEDDNKKCEPEFKSLRIPGKLPYFVLKNLNTEKMEVSLPTGSKIKITPKQIWEVLGIPMGKKLESDSPRDFNDEFLTAFKKHFEETENKAEVEKQKLKELIYETIEAKFESVLKEKIELEDMLKENMEMHELFYEDEKFKLFVKKFKEEFTISFHRDENAC